MAELKDSLEHYIKLNIPITKSLEIGIEKASEEHIIIRAPLAPNVNHKNTAFGGSLATLATLAAWSLAHVNLQALEHNYELVIAQSEIKYNAPSLMISKLIASAQTQKPGSVFSKLRKNA